MIALGVADFLQAAPEAILGSLAESALRSHRGNEPAQHRAWTETLVLLRTALDDWPEASGWQLVLEYPVRRLGRRFDAVLVTPRAILVLEFKVGQDRMESADRSQVDDYALDLADFHAGSRGVPILPVLVPTRARLPEPVLPLLLAGAVAPVLATGAEALGPLLRRLWAMLPELQPPLDVQGWAGAAYRPVPGIVNAARSLYARHGVADIAEARADAKNLQATTAAITRGVADARAHGLHLVLFVTGIPGAGKTLCGLNAVFRAERGDHATFLTGNPTLVHVLREALARDDAGGDRGRLRAARQKVKSQIQALPAFRDHHVGTGEVPPERVVVIDEAQRAWSRAHAIRKSADRPVRLTDSEPAHLLDVMSGHPDWAVIVALIGQGQEIHDGEAGLAGWGDALLERPGWQVRAPPALRAPRDARHRLPDGLQVRPDPALFLDVPMRSLRNPHVADWVDLVLAGNQEEARRLADRCGPMPFHLTRDLPSLRAALRAEARGSRRCGLLASSGAGRLRAEGLGAELPHMDAGAVARWFLDRWPDVRASDALELPATEFSCQGLELDAAGLCWGGDLLRVPGHTDWLVRDFRGTRWQICRSTEAVANRLNTYRVLMTRARYQTIIWMPRGDAADETRRPAAMDAAADFLLACGVLPLAEGHADAHSVPAGTVPAPGLFPTT